ncbi:MAG TPA: ABC transporter ATP-binding protein [Clostridiales bacterium]|nr:ABC transporter ATP-binding protein [Clostridiales bacterium]
MSETILEVQDLCKHFRLSARQQKLTHSPDRVKKAVDHLSFTAQRGEMFGLLGPNGAGKTTTLRMLATLLEPDSGDAIVAGASIRTQPEQVRSRIGFLTSELKLEECFTPNFLFDFFADLHQVPDQIRARRKEELFTRFDIHKFAEVKVANLSTGMKQKLSLVISIVHDPEIVIFDEPTNGLDVITARVVTNFLKDLRAQGKTVILSTHIFSLVESLCDRVGILIDGAMVRCGTLEDVCQGRTLEDTFFALYEERGNTL